MQTEVAAEATKPVRAPRIGPSHNEKSNNLTTDSSRYQVEVDFSIKGVDRANGRQKSFDMVTACGAHFQRT